MKMEYEFTDEQWQKIKKYLPKRKTGRPYKNLRTTVNGIYWIMKTGSTWRTLPPCFGKWQEVYQCFSRWTKEGVFEDIFKEVTRVADTSEISIDSTFVKVHQHALSGLKKELV
jgi:transposase